MPLRPAPVDQFFGEPGLADARFAADQEQPRPARRGGPPGVEQRAPFRLAADERIDGRARRRRDHGRRGVQVENLAVGDARRGARLDAELLLQQRGALLIEVQRRGALAAARVTTHERAPGLFVERIEPEQLLGVLDRVPEGAIVFEEADETRQNLAARAGGDVRGRRRSTRPRSRAAGRPCRDVPPPAGRRRSPSRPRSAAASNATRSTIAPGLVTPRQRARAGVDERVQPRPAFPQVVQLAAEIGQRLDVARFRPEGAGDALTRDRSAAGMEDEKGDELLLPRARRAGRRTAVGEESESSEQLDAHRGLG